MSVHSTQPNIAESVSTVVNQSTDIVTAELVQKRGVIVRAVSTIWVWICGFVDSLFGLAGMIVGLSVIATIPIIQILSLGYLLNVSARVAGSGRLRDAFTDLKSWSRIGGGIFATWVLLLPIRAIAGARDAALLLGNRSEATRMSIFLLVAATLMLIHLSWAWYRGARFRDFLWPAPLRLFRTLRSDGPLGIFTSARDRFFSWIESLQLRKYFVTGIHGFVVAFVWLFVPATLMFGSTKLPEDVGALVSLVAGIALATVLLCLPFLQVNCARDGSISSGFDRGRVKEQFRRAPIAYWFALLITLALALPLYLLKAELIPREAAWLPSIVFVISILPARIFAGWAVSRAEKRADDRHFVSKWAARLFAIPVVLAYSLVVYLSQYISWYGGFSLYEQHAFMLPVPFLGG